MTTPQGLAVSAAHDAAQARLLDRGLAELTLIYSSTLSLDDLDATARVYVPLAADSVRRTRRASASVARDFYAALRSTETADLPSVAPFLAAVPDEPAAALLETTATVTGPVTVKSNLSRGLSYEEALAKGLTATLGAATRLVEGGARDVVRLSTFRDPAARGWRRQSGGSPCYFCAAMIGRGPVYKSEGSASFRSHDHCHCKAVPVFGRDSGWTQQSADLNALWKTSDGSLRDFRRVYAASLDEALPAAA